MTKYSIVRTINGSNPTIITIRSNSECRAYLVKLSQDHRLVKEETGTITNRGKVLVANLYGKDFKFEIVKSAKSVNAI